MERFERRYDKNALRLRDVDAGIAEVAPEVSRIVKTTWDASFETPKIKAVYNSKNRVSFTHNLGDSGFCVTVGIRDIERAKKLYAKADQEIPAEALLKSMLGGELTTYASFLLNRRNFDYPEFSMKCPERSTLDEFQECVCKILQTRGVNSIGSKTLEELSGIYDPEAVRKMTRDVFDNYERRLSSISNTNAKKIERRLKLMSSERGRFSPKAQPKNVAPRTLEPGGIKRDNLLDATLSGTAALYVVGYIENGPLKLPEFIRSDFKVDDELLTQHEKFVEEYVPTFGTILETAISKLKK